MGHAVNLLGRVLAFSFVPVLLAFAVLGSSYGIWSVAKFGIYGHKGAKVYYDAYHGAHHLWHRGNRRHHHAYHTVSGYNRLYRTLLENGFEVDVATDHGFDRDMLDDYDVFYVGEQTRHGRFMKDREAEDLMDWVEDGGGLFAMAEHTNAHHMNDVFNRLFRELPLQARMDGITDRASQVRPFSADWVVLSNSEDHPHPITEGVEEYMFFAGCSMETQNGVLFSPQTAWADKYRPHKPPLYPSDGKRQKHERRGLLPGVAALDHGDGRIVVTGDHNALSNPNFYWGDHYRFAMQSFEWLAARRFNWDALWILAGLLVALLYASGWRQRQHRVRNLALAGVLSALGAANWYADQPKYRDILVYRGNKPGMKLLTKQKAGYYSFHGLLTKEPDIRPWAWPQLEPGYDSVMLTAPTKPLDEDQMAIIDDYLAEGKSVVYLANRRSLESEAGKQLQERFAFNVTLSKGFEVPKGEHQVPFSVHGPPALVGGILRFWVRKGTPGLLVEGLDPIVSLTRGSRHVEDAAWLDEEPRIHLLSERAVGDGRFTLLAPMELFKTESLGDLYDIEDPIQQQMSEFVLRVLERIE
jgi:hypothetical protein